MAVLQDETVRHSDQILLTARPDGIPGPEHFTRSSAPVPDLGGGELLVQIEYLSVDPAMRGWTHPGPNYIEPVELGAAMRAFAVGRVLESHSERFPEGSTVMGLFSWQTLAVVHEDQVWRTVREEDLSPSLSVGVLGLTGLTAWAGVRRVLRPRPGSTVVVSTAAGSVGSIVGQLAKREGCRTVGITGGPEKVAQCVEEFGYDAAVDYRSDTFVEDLAAATPDGIDHYFDNTSGAISDAVHQRLNPHSSVLICGTAAVPSWSPWPTGPRVERIMLTRRTRMEGFLAFDHLDALDDAVAELADLVRDGTIVVREHVLDGLDAAPGSIEMLYRGENTGKLLIRLPSA